MTFRIVSNSIPKEIKGLKEAGPEAIFEFVERMTMETHKRAIDGIQRGPASGKIRSDGSQASAPGEYPMSDTGRLASSVQFEPPSNKKKPEGIVGTNLLYGKYLELKPSTRGGRPWLLPAFNEATERADSILAKVFKRRGKL